VFGATRLGAVLQCGRAAIGKGAAFSLNTEQLLTGTLTSMASEARLAENAFVSLLRAADRVRDLRERVVEQAGVTGQQYKVLRILRDAEPDGLATLAIARRMIERAPGITRMIDRLEAKGLAARERRVGDRRYVNCRLTPKGAQLLKRLDQPLAEADRMAFAGMKSGEVEQLIALLDQIAL
jgi:DNA-binding MarR family transcriptional regulator